MAAQLLLINPKRRRRRNVKRRHVARHRRRNPHRHVAIHRRHRRRHVMRNPFRHRRRHRNPEVATMRSFSSQLMPAAIGAAGAVVVDIAYNYVEPYLPATLTSNSYFSAVAELVGAFGVGWAAGKVLGREKGRAAMVGAMTVAAYNILAQLLTNTGIMHGLGAYMNPKAGLGRLGRLGAQTMYNPAAFVQPGQGKIGYMPPGPFGAYSEWNTQNAHTMAGTFSEDMFA